ncbi:MAG: paraquat-inducible protein A [Cyclobacteriaceae bacterium]
MNRNVISFILTIISIGLLIPGLFTPILNINIGTEIPMVGKIILYEQTQNILETARTLYEYNNTFPAVLIILFSVIIPFVKAIIILIVGLAKNLPNRYGLYRFVYAIGKWSMADVFVVGIFIAYLSTESDSNVVAELKDGFYYFAGYCLVSLIGIQLLHVEKPES